MQLTAITLVGLLASTVAAGLIPDSFKSLEARGKKNAAKNAASKKGGAAAVVAGQNNTAGGAKGSALVLPDGRIAQNIQPEGFNVLSSVFKSAVVKGDGLLFSDVITFPNVAASLFDKAGNTKAFAINIDDKSVFKPEGGAAAAGNVLRADLLPSIRSTLDNIAVKGVRTLHFSVQKDDANKLDLTADYQLVGIESADFSKRQFDVRTGGANADNLVVLGSSAAGTPAKIFETPFGDGAFENFALKLDFDANTMQVFHSTGDAALTQATEPVANDLTGFGEYHFALQKNPAEGAAPQAAGVKEAIIYGGIFMEDSTSGTVTLQ